jgi:hypothetical protein
VYSAFTRMANFGWVKNMSERNQGRAIEFFSEDDQCGAERTVSLIPSERSGSVFQRTRNGRFMFSRR